MHQRASTPQTLRELTSTLDHGRLPLGRLSPRPPSASDHRGSSKRDRPSRPPGSLTGQGSRLDHLPSRGALGWIVHACALSCCLWPPETPRSRRHLKWPNDVLVDGSRKNLRHLAFRLVPYTTAVILGYGISIAQRQELPLRRLLLAEGDDGRS